MEGLKPQRLWNIELQIAHTETQKGGNKKATRSLTLSLIYFPTSWWDVTVVNGLLLTMLKA